MLEAIGVAISGIFKGISSVSTKGISQNDIHFKTSGKVMLQQKYLMVYQPRSQLLLIWIQKMPIKEYEAFKFIVFLLYEENKWIR